MHVNARLAGALSLLLIGSACAGGDAPQHFATRDSAGVSIATSRLPVWSTTGGFNVLPDPVLEVGGEGRGAGHTLSGVVAAFRLGDGRLAVADAGSSELRVFDAQGSLTAAFGRAGEGPGEMRALSRVFLLPGDSLLVSDSQLRRLTVFSADGVLQRTAPLAAGDNAASPVALLADNTLLARPGFSFHGGQASGVHRDSVTLARYALDGTVLGTAGRHPGPELFVFSDGGATMAGRRTFGKDSHVAAAGDSYWFGSADDLSLRLHAADGRLLRIVRTHRPLRRVTSADIDRVIASAGADDVLMRRMLAAAPPPDFFPAYQQVVADSDGFVWVREYAEGDAPSAQWQVFDPDGRWLGKVTLPVPLTVTQITHDEIVGVWRDDLDVEHVRVYRLARDPSGR